MQTSIVETFLRISDSNVMANILGIFDFIDRKHLVTRGWEGVLLGIVGGVVQPLGGTPHMKGVGMLVVSLRGVNFGFLVSLGVF